MAGRRKSACSETLTASPRLPQLKAFGPGPHRLHWIGGLKRSADGGSATGFDIMAQFMNLSGGRQEPLNVELPLTALPHLAVGSIWRNQMYSEMEHAETAVVTIDMHHFDPKLHAAQNPYNVIPPGVLALASVPERCWCRVLPLADGSEIIVPTWEILRTAYFFHPRLIPPFLGGAIDHPRIISPTILPWCPGPRETYRLSPDVVQITYPQFIAKPLALRLARLLFDEPAREGLRHVYRSIKRDAADTKSSVIKIPPVRPPFVGKGKWVVRYLNVPPFRGAPARRLVLSIHRIEQPLPYQKAIPIAQNNNQSTEHKNPLLPKIQRHQSRLILPSNGGLDLYGSAGDSKLQTVEVIGLELEDNAAEVEVVEWIKEEQRFRSGGRGNEPDLAVTSVALDSTGAPTPGRPELAAGDAGASSKLTQAANTLGMLKLIDMQRVFADVLKRLRAEADLAGWTVEPLQSDLGATGLLRVHRQDQGEVRPFIVLHIHHAHRHVYLIDAGRLKDHEAFSVLICETPDGSAISLDMFTGWLEKFPYPLGSRWLDHEPEGLLLRPDYLRHQPRDQRVTDDVIHKRFVNRLVPFVLDFIAGP